MNILREYEGSGIYTRYAADECPDTSVFSFHVHNRCEIYYFVSGNAEYLVEGSVYPLKKGDLLIMRPGEAHCAHLLSSAPYERYAVNFQLSILDFIDPERRLMKIYTDRPLGKGNLFFTEKAERHFSFMCGSFPDEYERRLGITSTLLFLLRDLQNSSSGTNKGSKPSLSEDIVAFVNDHLFDELSIELLSDHFFLSKSQFGRIFRQATGAPPWEYITVKRLTAARAMMLEGCTAKKAAEECGFGDYSVFYRAYVKRYGESPAKK